MVNIKYQYDNNGHINTRFAYARNCDNCKLTILDSSQYNEIKHQIKNGKLFTLNPTSYKTATALMEAAKQQPTQRKGTQPLPFEKPPRKPVNLSECGKTILIYAQKCHCAKCFRKFDIHTIIPRTARVRSVSGQLVDITVMFCAGCGQYYMAYESFKQYKKLYGRLLFECVLSTELQNGQASFLDFAPDSVLSRWGYSVKQDMPKEQRQAILRYLLVINRLEKYQAIEMIKGFISIRENQPKFKDACERWREDILFINNYKMGEQDVVYGLTFKQGGKIQK